MKNSARIFLGVWLVALGILSLLRAHADLSPKTPLSFHDLKSDQEIRFSVYTNNSPANFRLEISTQPKAQAKIVLSINSSAQLAGEEKLWGHPAGEPVVRQLTPTDLNTLEKFLADYQSKGALTPPALSGKPAIAFERITYRINQEGNRYADVDRKDFYPECQEAQQAFIKNFIGFSQAGNK